MNLGNDTGKGQSFGDKKGTASVNANFSDSSSSSNSSKKKKSGY
jgi:hypothetical protein